MHKMTAANLRSAHGGESMAHMRYRAWAEKAMEEGFPNVARLFTAISYAEEVHGKNHFRELGKVAGDFLVDSMAGFGLGSTSENLQGAYEGEMFEITEMYPAYQEVAKMQNEKGAFKSFHYAVSAEKIHAEMYKNARATVDQGRDITLGTVYICPVCGYTHEGEPPEKCPVSAPPRDKFVAFAPQPQMANA
jgi:rubrerythrin